MMDFVTVVFSGDLLLQKLQARSVSMFVDPALIGTIHIINNDEPAFAEEIGRTIVPEYGALADRVRIHHWTDLIANRGGATGWRSQQVLKLKIAERIDSALYLVLDGKNHFIRPVGEGDLVRNGKPITFVARPNGNLAEYFRLTMEYLGLDPAEMLRAPMPATTPYLLNTQLVRDMMNYVIAREEQPFEEFFLANRHLTEFYLYFGYLNLMGDTPEAHYSFGKRVAVTLFTRWPQRDEDIAKALGYLGLPQYKVFGLHRNRTASMAAEHREMIVRCWHDSGLVTDRAEAEILLAA